MFKGSQVDQSCLSRLFITSECQIEPCLSVDPVHFNWLISEMTILMKAIDVYLNEKKRCRAGVADGVVSATVSLVSGPSHEKPNPGNAAQNFTLQVGGLEGLYEYRIWLCEQVKVGDQIIIQIIESDKVDSPSKVVQNLPPDPKKPKTLRVVKNRKRTK